ncbi:type II secretion system protein GspG [Pyxidicoccus parkwayensis]|uniref:Type II secretion system protein GspG n=1 Tax=Pyxidicoccus parkwayensis TaxID=2813578 RepID=A0ABX7NV58_9BACT|nr:type II secretion system protein GspG [Pyxidicoccus parkwaysis]QSQ21274.1 type II secretion system protein GspG [Pyxidicoccus parkwaysis]
MLPTRPLRHALQEALKAALAIIAVSVFIGVAALVIGLVRMHPSPKIEEQVRFELRTLSSMVRVYFFKNGRLPPNESWAEELVRLHVLEQQPLDPWGNPYIYEVHGEQVELRSLGRDGAPGGDGADRDVALSFTVGPASTDAG